LNIIYSIDKAVSDLRQGRVLAYPTEAVYGLGCDPFNESAVEAILQLKRRDRSQGMILLISSWAQLSTLIEDVPDALLESVRNTWPGPVTWLFPKAAIVPRWICGDHASVAIRMTAHPVARQLCLDGPIVSTSANESGHPPARSINALYEQFKDKLSVVAGRLGTQMQPSAIYDVLSGTRLR
jgi:L-threonylcarbamoyladenylate synthase